MSRLLQVISLCALVIAVVAGVVGYNVFKTPEAASGSLAAIPLATSTTASASSATAVQATPLATAAPTTAATTTSAATVAASPVVFQIVQDESEARFIIDEVLNNAPKAVVGSTNQVAGEIAVDPNDPTKTQLGTIQVNARTLATDNDFRNRAIKNQILQTDQYELITFTPTQLVGLPQTGTVGESYSFQVVGDLTIRNVTKQVTMDVTSTAMSTTRLEGTAKTVINYADYGITIPSVPQVASVAEQVQLELSFAAAAI